MVIYSDVISDSYEWFNLLARAISWWLVVMAYEVWPTLLAVNPLCQNLAMCQYLENPFLTFSKPLGCYNMEYPSKNHLKLIKCHLPITVFVDHIILKFCTEHGSDTAVLCTKFQNDMTNEKSVMVKTRFDEIWIYDEFWRDILYCNNPQMWHFSWWLAADNMSC